jgi:hypothetical protein
MTLHRIALSAAVMAAFTYSASAVGPSPPEQPTAGGQGDRTSEQTPRVTPDATPGWTLMTQQERQQLQQELQAAKSRDECYAVMDKHNQSMTSRASARGMGGPGTAQRDICQGM